MWLLLSGDIESNPSPVNPTESNRKRKQNKSFPSICQECNKTVKANFKRLLSIHCNSMVHLKRLGTNSTNRLKSYDPQRWICCRCYLKELQFFNTQNLSEETISITDQTIQNNVHSEVLETNRNHLSIAHLNTQSMSSTFDKFLVMLYQNPFDIITLSETWMQNDSNLIQYVQIPAYSFCYKNQDERREGGVGMHIKDTIEYKEWQDLSKIDKTIQHMWMDRVSKKEQKQKLPCRCFLPISP